MRENIRKIILGITEKIKSDYQPEKIMLYGSFAYGKPDKDSDIDLLIIKKTKDRPIDRRIRVRMIVASVRGGLPFSSIVVTPQELGRRMKMQDQFFTEIVSKGKVLYAG